MRYARRIGWLVVVSAMAAAAVLGKGAVSTNEEKVLVVDDSLKITAWLLRDTAESTEPLIILLHHY